MHDGSRKIDWLGAILLVIAVGAPLAALELAFAGGDHAQPLLGALLAVMGVGAMAALIPIERRRKFPIFRTARPGRP